MRVNFHKSKLELKQVMDRKHLDVEPKVGDEKSQIGVGVGLVAPPTLEYQLLHDRRLDSLASSLNSKSDGVESDSGHPLSVGYCSTWGSTIAVGDLQGQTSPEPDWYHAGDFVCMHCLQPARGIPIGNPVAAEKSADNGGSTTWIVRGRFGSVGCALRYASDNRYTFSQETSGLLPLMLIRVYGFSGSLTAIPIAPARVTLPPFQPKLAQKWANGDIKFDGLSFHNELNKNVKIHAPDPSKHLIVSDHCAIMVDAQIPRDKLTFNATQLKKALPNLFTKPRPGPSNIPNPHS